MNQILLTDNDNNRKKSNRNNSSDIKKIITFFGVVILIFGIAMGGTKGYEIYKNRTNKEKPIGKPQLSLEETDKDVTIIAKAESGISKIIYSWNDEEENIRELNGRTSQEENMQIPDGNNTLKVKIIDKMGQEIETTKDFYRTEENSEKIEINTSVTEGGELKIVVTSELPIKYMSYKWNDNEEIKTEVQEENKKNMETTISIIRGKNTLNIKVEDIEGNINSLDKKFEGRLKPEFNVYKDGDRLYIIITHDKGFKKIDFKVNGIDRTYDENISGYDGEKQEQEFYFTLQEGRNEVEVKAVSNEDTEAEYKGQCDYTAQ